MENSNECKKNFVAVYDGSNAIEDLKVMSLNHKKKKDKLLINRLKMRCQTGLIFFFFSPFNQMHSFNCCTDLGDAPNLVREK